MSQSGYTPQKKSFFARHFLPSGLLVVVVTFSVTGVLLQASGPLFAIISASVGIFVFAIAYVRTAAMYRKRHYEFMPTALHYRSGGLFSDRETELKYDNVTHVRLIKPFFSYKLFRTGHILVEAAGSSGTEVILEAIDNPDDVYVYIQEVLARQSFRLQYTNKLSEEKPSPVAVLLELAGAAAGSLIALLFVLGAGEIGVVLDVIPLLIVLPIVFMLILGGCLFLYVAYQDLIRRTYYIYDDVVCYSRGFLTKQEAFIPVENMSDAELHQTFIDKILGLYDVVISCQGSGSQIHFKNLRNGKQVEVILDELINSDTDASGTSADSPSAASLDVSQNQDKESLAQQTDVPRVFYRDPTRTLLPYAPLILVVWIFPPVLIFPIWSYITLKRLEYRVGRRSVGTYFNFFTTKNVEFSQDKITGVILRRNFLDRYLGTCQLDFWSIGSAQAVRFQHIPYSDELEQLVKDRAGIPTDDEQVILRPDFRLKTWFLANVYAGTFFIALFLASAAASVFTPWLLLVGAGTAAALATAWYVLRRRYRRAFIRVGSQTIQMQIGWLFQRHYFVRLENVKDITSVQYPLTTAGSLQFNVAGEQIQSSGNSGSPQRVPNHFSLGYMTGHHGVRNLHDHTFDPLLAHDEAPVQTDVARKRQAHTVYTPALANDVSVIVLSHMIIFPLLLVLPFSLIGRIVWLRHVTYWIDTSRVVAQSGIIYRKQTTVVNSRIDYMKHSQSMLNKVWRNGTVSLYTTGSSVAELVVKNIPSYRKFHDHIKQLYER